MRKAITLALISVVVYCYSPSVSAVQEQIKGDWTAKVKETTKGRELWLSLRSDKSEDGRNFNNWGMEMPLQEFRGLDAAAAGQVQFNLMREAGTVTFDGLFKDGNGVGSFT